MTALLSIVVADRVRIPSLPKGLDSFRRWAGSAQFPKQGQFSYLNGELWVDPSMERLLHNQIKGIVAAILTMLVRAERLGRFIHDRMWLTCAAVNLSTEPDGMFVSHESLREGRVKLREGADSLEVEGAPDMALEVVSPTSIHKDTEMLRDLYARAGIPEYWLIDACQPAATLEILRLARRGYVSARKQNGWVKSAVFGKSLRLSQTMDEHDLPDFNLEWR